MKLKYALTPLTPYDLLKAVKKNPHKEYLFIRADEIGRAGRHNSNMIGFVAEVKTLQELKTEIESLDIDRQEVFARNFLKRFIVGQAGEKYLLQFLAEHINQVKFVQSSGNKMKTLLTMPLPEADIDTQARVVAEVAVFVKVRELAEQMNKMSKTVDTLGSVLHSQVLSGEITMSDAKAHLRNMLGNSIVISKKMKL